MEREGKATWSRVTAAHVGCCVCCVLCFVVVFCVGEQLLATILIESQGRFKCLPKVKSMVVSFKSQIEGCDREFDLFLRHLSPKRMSLALTLTLAGKSQIVFPTPYCD